MMAISTSTHTSTSALSCECGATYHDAEYVMCPSCCARLRAEVARKDAALKRIAEYKCHDIDLGYEYFVDTRDIARAAIGGEGGANG